MKYCFDSFLLLVYIYRAGTIRHFSVGGGGNVCVKFTLQGLMERCLSFVSSSVLIYTMDYLSERMGYSDDSNVGYNFVF